MSEGTWTIEAREYSIAGAGGHNYWVLYDPNGQIYAEMHGNPTYVDELGNTVIVTDPLALLNPFNTFQLKFIEFNSQVLGGTGDPNAVGGLSGLYVPDQGSQIVWAGSEAVIMDIWNHGVAAGDRINQLGVTYALLGGSDGDFTIGNSNSVAFTIAEAMAVAYPDLTNRWNPGDLKNLIPAIEQNLYRYNYYPNGTPIPPNSFYIPGDTWTSDDVVAATGVSLQDLQAVNPGVDLNNLGVGQTLNLPVPDNSLADFSVKSFGTPVQGTTGNDFLNGLALDDPSFTLQVNAAYLNGDGIYNVWPSGLVTEFYRPGAKELVAFDPNSIYNIWDSTTFNLQYSGLSDSVFVQTGLSVNLYGGASFLLNVDPLVLDLNGDGVKLTDYQSSPVFFDIDHDGGSLELTGWVSAQDGIVVMDLNSDGIINDSSEMLSEYYGGAQGTKPFSDGFAALASLDSNSDGQFDAADASFNTVRVWVDANHDAKTDAGELKTLTELNIARITLTATAQSGEVVDGNEVLSRGSYTTTGDVTRDAAAINFLANPNGHTFTTNGLHPCNLRGLKMNMPALREAA